MLYEILIGRVYALIVPQIEIPFHETPINLKRQIPAILLILQKKKATSLKTEKRRITALNRELGYILRFTEPIIKAASAILLFIFYE
jgi:hypothetical protein